MDTNGAGEAHVGKNNLDGSKTAALHLGGTAPAAKAVAPDGLHWVKNDDGDFLIVDEDSGNVAGERKYVLSLDSTTLALKEKGTGDLLAIAGGADNPRAKAKVAAMRARAAARVRAGAARATVAEARVARVAARVVPNNTVCYSRSYGQSASTSDGLPHLQLQWLRGSSMRCR